MVSELFIIPFIMSSSASQTFVESSSAITPTHTKSFAASISQLCSVKLDRSNYLIWECSILPIIRGRKLNGYILRTKECPTQFITENQSTSVNPSYKEWVSTDQLLSGWIYNTLTPDVASQLIGYATSKELWSVIKSLASAHTRSRVTLLKSELHRTRKGAMKMTEYLAKMKSIFDNFLLASNPISTSDLVTQTLAGLDIDYNPIVVQLSDKNDLSWVDLQAHLLTYES